MSGTRRLRSVSVALAVDMVGTGLFMPLSLLYFTTVGGIPLGTVGWCLSAASLVTLVLPLVVGPLVDRFGARRVVLAGLVAQGGGVLGYPFVHGAAGLLAAALVVAVGQRAYWSSVFTLVADLATEHDRDRWYAVTGAARNAGVGLGALAAAVLLGIGHTAAYQCLVAANGASFLAAAGLLWTVTRAAPRHRRPATDRAPASRRGLPRDRPYLALIAVNTVFALCSALLAVAVPVFLRTGLAAPSWTAGLLFGLNTAALAMAQPAVLRRTTPHRRTRVLALAGCGWAAWGLLSVLVLAVPSGWVVPAMVVVTACYTTAELLHAVTSNALAAAAAPDDARGRYLASFQFSFAVANAAAPAVFTQLYRAGPALPWLCVAVLATLAAAAMPALEHRLPARSLRTAPPQHPAAEPQSVTT